MFSSANPMRPGVPVYLAQRTPGLGPDHDTSPPIRVRYIRTPCPGDITPGTPAASLQTPAFNSNKANNNVCGLAFNSAGVCMEFVSLYSYMMHT